MSDDRLCTQVRRIKPARARVVGRRSEPSDRSEASCPTLTQRSSRATPPRGATSEAINPSNRVDTGLGQRASQGRPTDRQEKERGVGDAVGDASHFSPTPANKKVGGCGCGWWGLIVAKGEAREEE